MSNTPFPPFSDLTSSYLSSLFASSSSRSPVEGPPPSNPRTPSALQYRTPDPSIPPDSPSQPLTSITENFSPAASTRVRRYTSGECEELSQAPLSPTATELEHIQWKRRQNTLAARKSRKRKQEHLEHLENAVKRLTADLQTWRVRALTYQAMLKNHGIQVPDFT